jgi:hypothetical protein
MVVQTRQTINKMTIANVRTVERTGVAMFWGLKWHTVTFVFMITEPHTRGFLGGLGLTLSSLQDQDTHNAILVVISGVSL